MAGSAVVILGCFLPAGASSQSRIQVTVPAAVEWTDTGIDFLPGDALSIRAAGEWSNVASGGFVGQNGYGTSYPGTTLSSAPLASLIMRIDTVVAPASYANTTVRSRGRLYLGMNDVAGTFGDNRGSLNAYISFLLRPAPIADFTGQTVAQASKWLSMYRFGPTTLSGPSALPEGLIYDQSPKPGLDLHGVPEVTLLVSTGPPQLVRVPPVTGLPVDAALVMLRASGLGNTRVDSTYEPGPTAMKEDSLAWSVARQRPRAGSQVTKDSLIRLLASATPARRVPGFVGRTAREADGEAGAHGFSLEMRRHVGVRFFRSVVVSQAPPPGKYVPLSALRARVEVADPIPPPVSLAALAGLGALVWGLRTRPPWRPRPKPPPPGTTYHAAVTASPPELRAPGSEQIVRADLSIHLSVEMDPPQLAADRDTLIHHEGPS